MQTLAPEARSIEFAAEHDADGFIADELARRKALGYPPFASLIRDCLRARPTPPTRTRSRPSSMPARDAPGASVLGPAPLFRLRGRARSQIVIKATDRSAAIDAVRAALDDVAREAVRRRVSVSVDVDPQ